MKPVYRLQVQCPGEIVESIQSILKRRRGHIVQDRPIPGTLLYSVRGFLPVLDSFGFETDLRTFTQGRATVHSIFDHWAVVPQEHYFASIGTITAPLFGSRIVIENATSQRFVRRRID